MVKTEFKQKKSKRARKFIKDKAIVNFLLEHMQPTEIDFSKFKIPSYMNYSEDANSIQIPQEVIQSPNLEVTLLNSILEGSKN